MKNIAFIAFIVACLVQIGVPTGMVIHHEKVLKEGRVFRFKTAPVDPNDPFRGKYVQLRFDNNFAYVPDPNEWTAGETAYATLYNDYDGFAQIETLEKILPADNQDCLEVKIDYISDGAVYVKLPFDRFYLKENLAPQAEERYFEASRDTTVSTYALVHVKNGKAVLEDVQINGKSIKDPE